MVIYCVSYDLRKPERDYSDLYKKLEVYPYAKVVESTWLIESNDSPTTIREHLCEALDTDDCLIVVKVTAPGAWTTTIPNEVSAWIKRRL